MKGVLAVVALLAVAATGCDAPAAPSAVPGAPPPPGAAPFQNYAETVPARPGADCVLGMGCCVNRAPHRHCR